MSADVDFYSDEEPDTDGPVEIAVAFIFFGIVVLFSWIVGRFHR